jgi:Pentapeptide repeats (9 copies)/Protein of unknown function (DUF2934)/Pentapeptide repeats (8 copies)
MRMSTFRDDLKRRASRARSSAELAIRQLQRKGLLDSRPWFPIAGVVITVALLVEKQLTAAIAAAAAWIALMRHTAQTEADRQRRITDNFTKAAEQLSSEKFEVRLGGIYSLARISRESVDDYWPAMEILAAFVREGSHRIEGTLDRRPFQERVAQRAYYLWRELGQPYGKDDEIWEQAKSRELFLRPSTKDILAAAKVVAYRSTEGIMREEENGWTLDLSGTILKWVDLKGANFARANFEQADLEGTKLDGAVLSRARFFHSNLRKVSFRNADLRGANLSFTESQESELTAADCVGADFGWGDFSGARFNRATLTDSLLMMSILDRSQFMWADLTRARLEPKTFEGANFQCANLQGVRIETYGRENDMKRLAALLDEEPGMQARDMRAAFKLKWPE